MSAFEIAALSNMTRDRRVRAGIDRRRPAPQFAYPAPFVTQVMTEHQASGNAPRLVTPPRNSAVEAYRAGTKITARSAPSGLSHTSES